MAEKEKRRLCKGGASEDISLGKERSEDNSDTENKQAPRSWRDFYSTHPAAEIAPSMTRDELLVLGNDIKANGLRVPVVFLDADEHHGELRLLDGRSRLDAMELVGLDVVDEVGEFIDRARRVRLVSPGVRRPQ